MYVLQNEQDAFTCTTSEPIAVETEATSGKFSQLPSSSMALTNTNPPGESQIDMEASCTKATSQNLKSDRIQTTSPQEQPSHEARIPRGIITHAFSFTPAYPHTFHSHHSATVTTYHQSAFETVDYIYFTPLSKQRNRSPSRGFRLLSRKALPSNHTLLDLGPQPHQFLSSDHLLLQANFQFIWWILVDLYSSCTVYIVYIQLPCTNELMKKHTYMTLRA